MRVNTYDRTHDHSPTYIQQITSDIHEQFNACTPNRESESQTVRQTFSQSSVNHQSVKKAFLLFDSLKFFARSLSYAQLLPTLKVNTVYFLYFVLNSEFITHRAVLQQIHTLIVRRITSAKAKRDKQRKQSRHASIYYIQRALKSAQVIPICERVTLWQLN